MKINLVLPDWYNQMNGYNEILSNEIGVYIYQKFGINPVYSMGEPEFNSDMYIFVAQYRQEVHGTWLATKTLLCNSNSIVGIVGKAATESRDFILQNYPRINYVVKGECENTLEDIILRYLKKGSKNIVWDEVKGISYRKDNLICETPNRNCIIDYDFLPMPDFYYLNKGKKNYPICVISSSRGCHGNCKFCEGNINRMLNPGNIFRAKSAERVVDEIGLVIKKYGRKIFSFSDDNFMVDGIRGKERAKEIARRIINQKINIRFTIECRVDDVDRETFKELKRAGLHKVFLGIESGSQEFLDRLGKNITIEQSIHAMEVLDELGILCEPGYIFFDPMTTRKEIEETIYFFKKYSEYLYTPNFGEGSNKLFIPYESELMKEYWPNKDKKFYYLVSNEIIEYPFFDEEIREVYERYKILLSKVNKGNNILSKRIKCLEKSLSKETI